MLMNARGMGRGPMVPDGLLLHALAHVGPKEMYVISVVVLQRALVPFDGLFEVENAAGTT